MQASYGQGRGARPTRSAMCRRIAPSPPQQELVLCSPCRPLHRDLYRHSEGRATERKPKATTMAETSHRPWNPRGIRGHGLEKTATQPQQQRTHLALALRVSSAWPSCCRVLHSCHSRAVPPQLVLPSSASTRQAPNIRIEDAVSSHRRRPVFRG